MGSHAKPLSVKFLIGAAAENDFPDSLLPEIAFAGRSNVGKSSLLNWTVLNDGIARVSSTPGKTQQINFFSVESKWMFVDLPGYGYAKASKVNRKKWSELVSQYLLGRTQLNLVCVLVDSRHDPQPFDLETIEKLENQRKKYLIVLTKADKINEFEGQARFKQLSELVRICNYCVGIVLFSIKEKKARDQLLGVIKRTLEDSVLIP